MTDKKDDTAAIDAAAVEAVEAPAAVTPAANAVHARKNTWIAPVLITLAVIFAVAIGSRVAFGAARLVLGAGRGFGPGAMMGRGFDGGPGGQGYGRGGMMGRGGQDGRGNYGPGQSGDADGACPNCGALPGSGNGRGNPGRRGPQGPGVQGRNATPAPSQDTSGSSQGTNINP
jgi:hypothetical protein